MNALLHLFDHTSFIDSFLYGGLIGLAIAGGFCLFRNTRETFPRASSWAILIVGCFLLFVVTSLFCTTLIQVYHQNVGGLSS